MTRRGALALTVVALLAAACGGKDSATGTTTSTAKATTSTGAPSATSAKSAECGAIGVPDGATNVVNASGDVDGDGKDDMLLSYLVGESSWHLQVRLSGGGGADLAIATSSPGNVEVLGGADVNGDGRDEMWARTGSGASATILGLATFVDCNLVRVTFGGREPAELPVGGSVGTAAGVECAAHGDPSADLTTYTATNTGDDQYEVEATEYALEGTSLIQKGRTTSRATAGDETFIRASGFSCNGLSV